MTDFRCLVRSVARSGEARYPFGDPLADRYLEFAAGPGGAELHRV
jgi:hypothetical protein